MSPLATIIAQIESSNFPYALRFEWSLYNKIAEGGSADHATITAAIAGNHCTPQTAEMLYCTSFGLYQVMGFNLWGFLGWKLSAGEYLSNFSAQLNTFADFCSHNGINPATFDFHDDAQIEHFARVYNGTGAIPQYVAKMREAYASISKV